MIAYADDLAIIVRGKYLSTLRDSLNIALKSVENWCKKNKLSVNPAKSSVINFTKKRDTVMGPIRIYGKTIKEEKVVKFLGISLDAKLSMKAHIERTCNNALRSLFAARAVVKRHWGLSPKMSLWLYNQVILPRITYGALTWWNKAQKVTIAAQLNKVQRVALLMITGAMKTTPTLALNVALNIPPLEMRIFSLALASYYRLKFNGLWRQDSTTGDGGIRREAEQLISTGNADIMPNKSMARRFTVTINDRTCWNRGVKLNNKSIVWYTDGSKRDDKIASGIYCKNSGYTLNIRLSDHATVMQAEVIAIELVAEHCLQNNVQNKEIIICCDSQAALRALNKEMISSKTVKGCYESLNMVALRNMILLLWVPGHSGIRGKEIADAVANEGIGKPDIERNTYQSRCEFKTKIMEKATQLLNRTWKDKVVNKGIMKHSSLMLKGVDEKKSKKLIKSSKNKLRIITGIITGHCCLNYLHRIGKASSPLCRFCKEENEDMIHIIGKCERFAIKRKLILGEELIRDEKYSDISTDLIHHFIKEIKVDKILLNLN